MSQSPPSPNFTPPAPSLEKKISVLGVKIDTLTREDVLALCKTFMQSNRVHQIITSSSLMILEAHDSLKLKKACEYASLVLPDSAGISWAARYLKLDQPYRFPGIDLAFELCQMAQSLSVPVYFLGGASGVAENAAAYISKIFPRLKIGGRRDGFFDSSEDMKVINEISASQSKLVFVALGMPKQEIWIHEHRDQLSPGLYVGVGGSFDVWAGRLRRAPGWLRRSGMEWLFRLTQEPSRWRRIARLPQFAFKVILERFYRLKIS